jgi:uncharacterized protein
MPRGASPKRERQYEHIKQSAKKSGRYGGRAEEVAARTVNKIRREKGETRSKQSNSSSSRSKKPRSKGSSTRSRKPAKASLGQRVSAGRRTSSRGRGFAGMSERRQREIAAEGGRAAHKRGTAHEFSSSEARRAGQKGGEAVSRDRSHMAKIGRKGGER